MKNVALIILLLIVCCGLIVLFWNGYYLPQQPCRPISYPGGQTTTAENASYITPDNIEIVLHFFDRHLDAADPSVAVTNQWRKVKTNGSSYLYYCYAGDVNLITTESGCIYIKPDGNNTLVRSMFFRSEGTNTPCPQE